MQCGHEKNQMMRTDKYCNQIFASLSVVDFSFLLSYIFDMQRKAAQSNVQSSDPLSHKPSTLCVQNILLNPKSLSRRQNKKQSSLKLSTGSVKYSLSQMKLSTRSNTNTIFSSRLFNKAHRLESSNRQSFLPEQSFLKPDNQVKQRRVYQAYQRLYNRDKIYSSFQQEKKKQPSVSLHHNTQTGDPIPQTHKNEPFSSSLTQIIINQCKIDEENQPSGPDFSEWVNILCEGSPTSTRKKTKKQTQLLRSTDNPYELLQLRRRRGHKENRSPLVSSCRHN